MKNKNLFGPKRGRGRPVGSVKVSTANPLVPKKKPGRPAATSKNRPGRGRPPGAKNKKK